MASFNNVSSHQQEPLHSNKTWMAWLTNSTNLQEQLNTRLIKLINNNSSSSKTNQPYTKGSTN